jgi:hypothetical protein
VDYYDRSGWMLHGDLNYAQRYVLNGQLSGSYTRKMSSTNVQTRRWDLVVSHNHTIDPTMTLRVDGRFQSDDSYYKNFSSNLNQRLNREIRSNATFAKTWREQRMNLRLNLSHVRDIDDKRTTLTLPQMSFSLSQRKLFGDNSKSGASSIRNDHWYNNIYYSYGNNLTNTAVLYDDIEDTTKSRKDVTNRTWDHNASMNFNAPGKILGVLTGGLSFNYNERWYDRYRTNLFNSVSNKVEADTLSGFKAKRTFSLSMNTSTKLYGYVEPNIGWVKAIRHVITPQLSFSYTPNFSEQKWGYVDVFHDTTGKKITANRLMDGVSSTESKSMNFSLENLFQMKTTDGEKEKKFDLFAINSSTSYNFEAKTNKLSALNSSIRTSAIRNLSTNISMTHDWYRYGAGNKLMMLEDKSFLKRQFLRLTSFRFSANIRFQGSKKQSNTKSQTKESAFTAGQQVQVTDDGNVLNTTTPYNDDFGTSQDRFEPENSFSGPDIPWKANLSFDYSLNKTNPNLSSQSFYVNLSGVEIQLTKNWRINYAARYDIKEKTLINHSFTFYRSMHCWEARFDWRPSGIGAPFFYLRINVLSTQLSDLKYEKRGGRRSIIGY